VGIGREEGNDSADERGVATYPGCGSIVDASMEEASIVIRTNKYRRGSTNHMSPSRRPDRCGADIRKRPWQACPGSRRRCSILPLGHRAARGSRSPKDRAAPSTAFSSSRVLLVPAGSSPETSDVGRPMIDTRISRPPNAAAQCSRARERAAKVSRQPGRARAGSVSNRADVHVRAHERVSPVRSL